MNLTESLKESLNPEVERIPIQRGVKKEPQVRFHEEARLAAGSVIPCNIHRGECVL